MSRPAATLILDVAARHLLPVLLVFAVFLLIRGHNEPGGGFVGGLVAASALALYVFAFGGNAARRLMGLDPRTFITSGVALALASGLAGPLSGKPFLTAVWLSTPLPVVGKIGTPIAFDAGVFLAVVGVVTTTVLTLAED
jgi:multicomponent Na+:H+ antiporter subunit B